ncbi:MAG: hypothetical protein MZW92_30885 [Comamonadaceae bacterium]|nr:hypothetical protein [Comamonadaceae bacterium]
MRQALIDGAQRRARRAVATTRPAPTALLGRAIDALAEVAALRRRAGAPWPRCCAARRRSCEDAAHTLAATCGRARARSRAPGRARRAPRRPGWRWRGATAARPAELPALLARLAATSSQALDAAADLDGAGARRRRRPSAPGATRPSASAPARAGAQRRGSADAVTQAMQQLGMAGGRFEVALRAAGRAAVLRPGGGRVPRRRPRRQHAAPAGQGGLGRRAVAPGAGHRRDHRRSDAAGGGARR